MKAMSAVLRRASAEACRAPTRSPSIDGRALRAVLGCFPTGVTVVTATTEQGPVGITANSFTSVSLDPPLVLFCIASSSRRRDLIQSAGAFAVNILSEDQQEVSRAFAAHPHKPFAFLETKVASTGAPVLLDALAYIDCRLAGEIEAGDHLILIGEVLDLNILRNDPPLVFFRSVYTHLAL